MDIALTDEYENTDLYQLKTHIRSLRVNLGNKIDCPIFTDILRELRSLGNENVPDPDDQIIVMNGIYKKK